MQVVDQSTKQVANSMALLNQTIYPSRGLIYDRNGELLVYNQPIYDITIIVKQIKQNFDTIGFCNILGITREEFEERMADIQDRKKNRSYSQHTPQLFASQLSKEELSPLQESLHRFKGVNIRKRTLRDYTYNSAAQVLGSVGEVSQKNIEADPYYTRGDYSGQSGLEKTYENYLRGEKGVEIILRDNKGRLQGSYMDGQYDKKPISGGNLITTLDIRLQILAEQLLSGKIGSVVAIEPTTGEILALASNPTWDPKLLVGKQRSENYRKLLNDKTKPLMNRASQAQYSPGSTFKTIQALSALQEKVITPRTIYPCSGPSSTPIRCTHHHGSAINLENAIEQSCNPYFWGAYRDLLEKNKDITQSFNIWREDIKSFGLGERFKESDIGEQSRGSIPSVELYNKLYGVNRWNSRTIRSLSIGQGEILVTPLQLANQAAAIANEGYYITPHLNKTDSFLTKRHDTKINKQYFACVKQGMRRVMTNGTGRYYQVDSLQMCGKTGTVQNAHGKDHAIFIGFAPLDNPQIAVAVVVENAGFGATWAAPIASLVMEQYLTDTIQRQEIKQRISTTRLNPDVKE